MFYRMWNPSRVLMDFIPSHCTSSSSHKGSEYLLRVIDPSQKVYRSEEQQKCTAGNWFWFTRTWKIAGNYSCIYWEAVYQPYTQFIPWYTYQKMYRRPGSKPGLMEVKYAAEKEFFNSRKLKNRLIYSLYTLIYRNVIP